VNCQFTILSHGHTAKTVKDHRFHILSGKGREQAQERRAKLGNPTFDCVFHSPLPCTRETACLVAGLREKGATTPITTLFYDRDHPHATILDQAFQELGCAPLEDYCKTVQEEIRQCALDAFLELGDSLVNQEKNGGAKISNVLIVGHIPLLLALCIQLTGKDDPFMERVLGECEGYQITMAGGCVTRIDDLDALQVAK